MYEAPEVEFDKLAVRFMDIRKRVYEVREWRADFERSFCVAFMFDKLAVWFMDICKRVYKVCVLLLCVGGYLSATFTVQEEGDRSGARVSL